MVRFHYFETLEELSELAVRAVFCSCVGTRSAENARAELCSLRVSADKAVCELEDALFSDYLPPLERDSIAACAHCLSRVIDRAIDLCVSLYRMPMSVRDNAEAEICVELARSLHSDISLLRTIRKPSEMPSHRQFRALLAEGRAAHTASMSKISTGALPKNAASSVIMCGKLRAELARSFDELVEIMLNNI